VREGIALRKFGQQVIEGLAKERVHPSWTVPGGVNAPLEAAVRDRILKELPAAQAIARRTIKFFKGVLDQFAEEISAFGTAPTMYAGMVDAAGGLQLYDGQCASGRRGNIVLDQMRAADYQTYIGEAVLPFSYLKAPYYKAGGVSRRDLSRGAAGAAERGRPLRHAGADQDSPSTGNATA